MKKTTSVDEILIRFAANGTPSAHQRRIVRWAPDAGESAADMPPAQYLDVEPMDVGAIGAIVAASQAQLLAENAKIVSVLTAEQKTALGIK